MGLTWAEVRREWGVELETYEADQERERQRDQYAENDLPTKGNLGWQQVRTTLTRSPTP